MRKGTLFIDAVDALPLPIQGRLVEALVKREVRAPGHARATRFAGRLIFGIRDTSAIDRVHPALWKRLSWARFNLPIMRDRRAELAGWARWMLTRMPAGERVILAADAVTWIEGGHWPENLNSLEAVLRRALTHARQDSVAGQPIMMRVEHLRAASRVDADQAMALRDALRNAATHFIELAASLPADTLSLRQADAFSGVVLEQAIARFGKREAFVVLGRGADLERDNHHRTARRHASRVAALEKILATSEET